jgi:murein DD-endopeptidase MepM/ murein hydrolase activator NlpD
MISLVLMAFRLRPIVPSGCVYIVRFLVVIAMLLPASLFAAPSAAPEPFDVQAFLDRQPGVLKTYRDGKTTAAQAIQGFASYYSLDPRIILTLLELEHKLVTAPQPTPDQLARPWGTRGPLGFNAQIDWATRELRAGFGPYTRAPEVQFTDGKRATIALDQEPSVIAVQRFLAPGRTEAEWTALKDGYAPTFKQVFGATPESATPTPTPAANRPFLGLPWVPVYPNVAGDPLSGKRVRMIHSSYFDHVYPTVDRGGDNNGFIVTYLNQGNLSYNTHDGHDYYFPDRPTGTPIVAAAPGMAYAYTARGNGVVIKHGGAFAGYETVYWHLDAFAQRFANKIDTGEGIAVRAGDYLGTSGKSGFTDGGAHLHFEVRHNGKQVDPYGWYGPGSDPCARWTAGCEASVWLWNDSLRGVYDFTPPVAAPVADKEPPIGTLNIVQDDELRMLVHFDGHPLQDIGTGMPTFRDSTNSALPYEAGVFDKAARLDPGTELTYPISPNLTLEQGTLSMWVNLPTQYPASTTNRQYVWASSSSPGDTAGTYTSTLALRREVVGSAEQPQEQWNFWTVDDNGARHDLLAREQLEPGWHHFAIGWEVGDDGRGTKTLYIDGVLRGTAKDAPLPATVGERLEIGRWTAGFGEIGAAVDELAVWGRRLSDANIRDLAAKRDLRTGAEGPLGQNIAVASREIVLDTNAIDRQGGIVGVRLRRDDEPWSDPSPYYDSYRWTISGTEGLHTFAVEFRDRADNVSVVTQTVKLVAPPKATATLEQTNDRRAILRFTNPDNTAAQVQVSSNADFAGIAWNAIPAERSWLWLPRSPRIVYIRFRTADGITGPTTMLGPDAARTYLPSLQTP